MPRHISLVFPGQGSQHVGMLESIDSCFIDEVKLIVNSALDFDLIDIINRGNSEDLTEHQSLNQLYYWLLIFFIDNSNHQLTLK